MNPTGRAARVCAALALTCTTASTWAATHHHPWYALTALYTAAVLAWCAARLRVIHREWLTAVRRIERQARPVDARAALDDGCCERWSTSAGTEHDPAHCLRKDQTT